MRGGLRPDAFNGVALTDGAHIDYMEGGNVLRQLAEYLVSGFSHRENIDAAGIITAGWANDMFGCTTRNGVYGSPGQSISIPTPTKPATAVVLPLGPAGPSSLGEYFDCTTSRALTHVRKSAVEPYVDERSRTHRRQPAMNFSSSKRATSSASCSGGLFIR